MRPLPELIDNNEEYKVEAILDLRRFGQGCKLQYLIKWKGYPNSENQWEDANNVHADELVCHFQKWYPSKEVHLKMGHSAEFPPFSSMSSPDIPTLELNATLVPTISDVDETQHHFPTPEPGRLSLDSTQTV